ncbi:MAG: MFS transporter [Bacteroidota bacterium]
MYYILSFFKIKIPDNAKQSFRYHIIYSIIDGFILGLFALNEFILIKSLKGSNYQIAFLFQVMVLVLLFSVFFGEILRRVKKKKKLIRIVGIATRIPLIFLFFFPDNAMNLDENYYYQIAFLAILMIYYFANPLLFPAINHLLKNSYSHEDFGKLYSYASTVNKVMMMVATFLFGLLLDYNNYAFTYIYPMVAILGISSIFILTKIEYHVVAMTVYKANFFISVYESIKKMILILKGNKPYRDFEISFMFYGFAWMATAAVITIFFEKALHLNYSSIAFYKNAYNTIAILLLPYFGKLIGKMDPRKFAVYTFGFLLLHLFFLGLTEYYDVHFEFFGIKVYYSLIASYIFYGLFAATMALLWYIGSAYFCKDEEVSDYQSVHLTLTGFRGIFSPLVGVFFFELFGFTGVFLLGIISLAIAMAIMLLSMKRKGLVKQ